MNSWLYFIYAEAIQNMHVNMCNPSYKDKARKHVIIPLAPEYMFGKFNMPS